MIVIRIQDEIMTTKQMEYILELSKMKNFNRAAENLFISQPALTYQIKTVEEEIGFRLFERSGRGVTMTPAGAQFVIVLENVLEQLEEGMRQGQMHDSSFSKGITVGLPYRSALYYLPEAVDRFRKMHPESPVTPYFNKSLQMQPQEKLEWDIEFSILENARRMSGVKEYPLFESRLCCGFAKDDPLVQKKIIRGEDIKDRRLVTTNTKYPNAAHHVLRDIIGSYHNAYFLVADVQTILHTVASHSAVAFAPGFVNDHNGELVWIPYDCKETLRCVLLTGSTEKRQNVLDFIRMMQDVYAGHKEDLL